MPDLRIERDFDVSADELWSLVTTPEGLLGWWGPEGVTVPDHALDFTRAGPWYSVMIGTDGQRYKVSGQVTHVRPRESVGFTWAWHDDRDQRGAESHVTLQVTDVAPGRARLTLDHVALPDDQAAEMHQAGWVSSLKKLERQCAPA